MEDMKMKKIFTRLFAFTAIFAAFSCAGLDSPVAPAEGNQAPEGDQNGEYTTLSITAVETKSYIDHNDDDKHKWNGNDKIHVFDSEGNRFTFTGEKTASESFVFTYDKWPVGHTPVYALFSMLDGEPVFDKETNKITTVHPSEQRIVNTNSFGRSANTSVAKIEPDGNGNYTAQFKNICGLVKFATTKSYVEEITIESVDNTPIAGEIVIDYNNGEPTFDIVEGESKITLTPKSKTDTETGEIVGYVPSTYYACLLPCNLNGIKVTIKNMNGRSELLTGSALMSIQRGKQVNIGTLDQRTIEIDFASNSYGILTTAQSEEKSCVAVDNFNDEKAFAVGFNGSEYAWVSNKYLHLIRNYTYIDEVKTELKYGYIKLPNYDTYFLESAVVDLNNASKKTFNIYEDVSPDGLDAPDIPIASQKQGIGPRSKDGEELPAEPVMFTFSENTSSATESGKAERGKSYYLTGHAGPMQIKKVTLTYTFTSEGPDATETSAE